MHHQTRIKSLLTLLVGILLSAPALASWNSNDDPFTGPYLGVNVGVNGYYVNQQSTTPNGLFPQTPAGASAQSTNNPIGVEGGLLLGYGYRLPHHFYLGSEIYGMLSSAHTNTQSNLVVAPTTSVKQSMPGSYGLNIDPGIFLSKNTLLYFAVGPVASVFHSSAPTGDAALAGSSATFTKNVIGAKLGLGMETNLTQRVNLRLEYDHSFYPSFNETSTSPTQGQVNSHYQLSNNEMLLSFVFHV